MTSVAHQIAKGMAVIHGKNLVHRDLRSENIFIAVDPNAYRNSKILVKIGDFGHMLEESEAKGRSK